MESASLQRLRGHQGEEGWENSRHDQRESDSHEENDGVSYASRGGTKRTVALGFWD